MAIKNVIFDMDGVIHVGKTLIPGAVETVSLLRKSGLKVFFLTNNAERVRTYFVEKLNSFGIDAVENEVYSSGYGVARYIKENLAGKRVFAFSKGMQEELVRNGVEVDLTKDAEVVIAGHDGELTYAKLATAFRALIAGAVFLASNEDKSFPVEDGLMPGAMAVVAALSSTTGKKPLVIGKPNPYLLDVIIREHGLKKEETLMVGDRLETDILMAKQEGLKSAFALSGVSRKDEMEKTGLTPDYVIESIAELPKILGL